MLRSLRTLLLTLCALAVGVSPSLSALSVVHASHSNAVHADASTGIVIGHQHTSHDVTAAASSEAAATQLATLAVDCHGSKAHDAQSDAPQPQHNHDDLSHDCCHLGTHCCATVAMSLPGSLQALHPDYGRAAQSDQTIAFVLDQLMYPLLRPPRTAV